MLKKIINIFFVLLLATQVLPIKEVGKMLSSSAIQEEEISLEHGVKIKITFAKSEFTGDQNTYSIYSPELSDTKYIYHSVQLPHNHSAEMLVPPPNFV